MFVNIDEVKVEAFAKILKEHEDLLYCMLSHDDASPIDPLAHLDDEQRTNVWKLFVLIKML